jgi:hypothetical protein
MTTYDSNIYEMIDNELSLSPYQSLTTRTKRYFKRNIIKMYKPAPVYHYNNNPSFFYYFLRYYFIITFVHFIFSFLKIY